MTAPSAARKNQWGNRIYPIPKVGELEVEELPSVSQILKTLSSPGLEVWKLKQVAEQFSKRPDLVMLAADPSTRYDAVQQALSASKPASNTGTALHTLSEMVDSDTLDWNLVTENAKPWVAHYAAAKEAYGWKLVKKEFTVYNHAFGYAGTSDRALDIPGYGVVIADLKTGASLYSDQAFQLAMYAFGEGIWNPVHFDELTEAKALEDELIENVKKGTNIPAGRRKWSQDAIDKEKAKIDEVRWEEYCRKGSHEPMPEGLSQDVGVIIHLASDGCELVPFDISGLKSVIKGLCEVYHWKERKDIIGDKLEPQNEYKLIIPKSGMNYVAENPVHITPDPSREDKVKSLRERIVALSTEAKQQLAFNWPQGVATFRNSTSQTNNELQKIEDVLWSIEVANQTNPVEKILDAFPGSKEEKE